MNELKACPFCKPGKDDLQLIDHDGNGQDDYVWCGTCGAEMLIELWNTRPLEDALTATIKEQGELIEKLKAAVEKAMEYTANNGFSKYANDDVYYSANEALIVYRQWKEKQK